MKEIYVKDISKETEIIDFFMIKESSVKIGANKKQYLDVLLCDKTGEVSSKKWDLTDAEVEEFSKFKENDIVKIRAQINSWNGMAQFRIMRIRPLKEEDVIDISDFIKAAPEKPGDMYQYVIDTAKNFEDEDLKKLCLKIWEERKEKILFYPAASKNHHAELGGFLYHIKTMLMAGENLCQVYKELNRDLLLCGVMLHDIEKLTEIESNEYGMSSGYSFEGQLLGHIISGIKLVDREMEDMEFSNEKKIMIEHMILSHHYEPEYGSPKKPLFPEAEMLHYLDIIDARMYDMSEALVKTEKGDFSERVWVLENRKLYKPE